MKKLNLQEAPKTIAFTFGRFNPPTTGHEKLCDAVKKANSSDYKIFASQKQDPNTDPLQYAKKVAYMKKSFPKHKSSIVVSKSRNIFDILVELNNYENLIMVVGSDRVAEFKRIINEYNGVKSRHGFYEYKTVQVLSAGERDPDAEGVAGMSASKMRASAVDSDFDSFKLGTPLKDIDAKKLYFDVRKSMGIREELDLTDYETLRDLYLLDEIWNVGDLIKIKGKNDDTHPTWEIIRRGTNYITAIDENYKSHKVWLHDIDITEVKQDKDVKDKEGTQPAKYYAGDMAKSTKDKRDTHFKKKKDGPAPGDSTAKTKPSTHTKKFKDMFGEEPRISRKKGQPAGSDSHSDLYTDENPKGTIQGLKFATVQDARDSVKLIINSGKTHAHKIQAAIAMEQRAKEMGKSAEAGVYRSYIEKMKEKTKKMNEGVKNFKEYTRDYKDEYKKFQSSPEKIKYRAELVKYNRDKGTYGNGDNKDASHKDGKIVGFEDQTKNRGKAESSRLKGSKRKTNEACWDGYKKVGMKKKGNKMVPNCVPEEEQIDEKIKGLVTKADKSKMPYGILKKVYDRGMAAWKTGHRPGTTPQQWAFARVNSFIKSSGTWGKADADLAKQVRGESIEEAFKFFPNNVKDSIQLQDYPKDDERELSIVRKFINTRTPEDEEEVANNDKDSFYSIKEYCKNNGIVFHDDELSDIVTQAIPTIKHFKNKFNRSRPFELDGNLDVLGSTTNKTRSYPSGHSCQSMLVALYVADKFPEHRDGIIEAAKTVGMGRVKAGFHYLSDHLVGQQLGKLMYGYMNKEDYGQSLREYYLMGTPEYDEYLKKLTPGESKMNEWDELDEDSEYQGRKVKLNNPTKGDIKKYKVYVRNDKGNVVKVEFGDPNMEIKRDSPARLKAFRARHNCDQKTDKTTAGYWSCKFWEKGKSVTDLMKG